MPSAPSIVDLVLGNPVDYVTLAVPFFAALIALEVAFVVLAGRDYYRFNDSITDLSCGIIEQTLGLFLKTALFAAYIWVYENYRLWNVADFSPPAKLAAAMVLFLGVDCCFYWFHRFAHVMAAPWATHVVHHSSEEMNLVVALRQSAFEDCFAWGFYLPLALAGFPPLWYGAMFSFNLIWQFWCHTRAVGKLGPLEWIFNTPSHHRVHHARNPRYLDKNYAGTLIIWDRMFGTFEEEIEEPVYGITKPLASWNPLWANLHYWVELAQLSWRAPYLVDKIKVWFMPLGWTPRGLEPERYARPVTPADVVKYNARVPWGLNLYVLTQFLATFALGSYVSFAAENHVPLVRLAAPALFVLWGLVNFGGLFEHRRWAWGSETLRVAVAVGATIGLLRGSAWSSWGACGVAAAGVASLAWLAVFRHVLTAAPYVPVARAGYRADLEPQPATRSPAEVATAS